MFTFIKFIQGLFLRLKHNKGLWFTTLGLLSISGIFLSMYILFSLTKDVTEEIYVSTSHTYNTNMKNLLNRKESVFNNILFTIKTDAALLKSIKESNHKQIIARLNDYNNNYKRVKIDFTLKYFPAIEHSEIHRNSISSSLANKNSKFGLEIFPNGIYTVLLEPVFNDDKIIGILEIKEKINFYKEYFLSNNKIFLVLLEERMLNKLSKEIRKNNYVEVIDDLYTDMTLFNSIFYGTIREAGMNSFKEFMDKKYTLDNLFFKTYRPLSDINGNDIGYIIMGESVEGKTFINIVQDMTKTITTVALGLVISILLFMF